MSVIPANWPYVNIIPVTGDTKADVRTFLRANGKEKTLYHCEAVAGLAAELAKRFGEEADTLETAGMLHDVSCVVNPTDMPDYALRCGRELDESEKLHPFLLHGYISAALGKEFFGVSDPSILSAVECHSTLKAEPSCCDLLLFISDKLAWDQAGEPPFYREVNAALTVSLERAALTYIDYIFEHKMLLSPHKRIIDARTWLTDRL
jgi:Predicted HD superfamily hydrolase involved in NAD metabolism